MQLSSPLGLVLNLMYVTPNEPDNYPRLRSVEFDGLIWRLLRHVR